MNELRLYLDVEIADPLDGTAAAPTYSFGPFSDRGIAEQALIAFIGRENAVSAIIRDPNAGAHDATRNTSDEHDIATAVTAMLDGEASMAEVAKTVRDAGWGDWTDQFPDTKKESQ